MTEDRLPLAELLAKAGDGDFLRSVEEAVVQLLMEADVEGLWAARAHGRAGDVSQRLPGSDAGYPAGQLATAVPKLREGS
jgi:putative transposase